jgi:hypothetical protein
MRSFQRNDEPARDDLAHANRIRIRRSDLPTRRRRNGGPAAQPAAATPARLHGCWENCAKSGRGTGSCRISTARWRRFRPIRKSSYCQVLRGEAIVRRSAPAASRRAFLDAGAPRSAPTTRAAVVPAAARAARVEVQTAARAVGAPLAAGVNGVAVAARTALRGSRVRPRARPNHRSPTLAPVGPSHGPRVAALPHPRMTLPAGPIRWVVSPHPVGPQRIARPGADAHPGPPLQAHTPQRHRLPRKPREPQRVGRRRPQAGSYPRPAAAAVAPAVPRARR